jgi:hypothetical protein
LQVKQEQRKTSLTVGLWNGSKSGNRCLVGEDRSASFQSITYGQGSYCCYLFGLTLWNFVMLMKI